MITGFFYGFLVFSLLLGGAIAGTHNAYDFYGKIERHEIQPAFFNTAEALAMANNFASWQMESGGWSKRDDIDGRSPRKPGEPHKKEAVGTLDNGQTTGEMLFIAEVLKAQGKTLPSAVQHDLQETFLKGVNFLRESQASLNGGFPQEFPPYKRKGYSYSGFATLNDDVTVHAMRILRQIRDGEIDFLKDNKSVREQAGLGFRQGLDFLLQNQIKNKEGHLIGWAQQYSQDASGKWVPARARSYELPSVSTHETAAIAHLLIEEYKSNPNPELKRALDGAMAWLKDTQLRIHFDPTKTPQTCNQDPKEKELPYWPRFIDPLNGSPFFALRGTDGENKPGQAFVSPSLNPNEICKAYLSFANSGKEGEERSRGYLWFTQYPGVVLAEYNALMNGHEQPLKLPESQSASIP